jgi:hypothetical protein
MATAIQVLTVFTCGLVIGFVVAALAMRLYLRDRDDHRD